MPPSTVNMLPVVYPDRSDARKAAKAPISPGLAALPNGRWERNSRHLSGEPCASVARALSKVSSRSVRTGPGLIPVTRTPSAGRRPPPGPVEALRAPFPDEPPL